MPNYESAAELDKALEDGSFEDSKAERYDPLEAKPEQSPLDLTDNEKKTLQTAVDFVEAAHKLDAIRDAAEAAGDPLLARQAGMRSNELRLRGAQIAKGEAAPTPEESDGTRFDQIVSSLRVQLQGAQQRERAEDVQEAREDVTDALEDIEEAAPIAHAERPQAPQLTPEAEVVELPLMFGQKGVKEAFDDLQKLAKANKGPNTKYVLAAAKTAEKHFIGEFKKHEKRPRKDDIKEQLADRNYIKADAQKRWKELHDMLRVA